MGGGDVVQLKRYPLGSFVSLTILFQRNAAGAPIVTVAIRARLPSYLLLEKTGYLYTEVEHPCPPSQRTYTHIYMCISIDI